MKIYFVIFLLIIGVSIAEGKSPVKSDFKAFSKKIAVCLKKEDKECLKNMVLKKMYLIESEDLGCKAQTLSAGEFSDCVFTSTKKYTNAPKERTLKEILHDCFTASDVKISVDHMSFESSSGYHCSVEMEDGKLKLENVTVLD